MTLYIKGEKACSELFVRSDKFRRFRSSKAAHKTALVPIFGANKAKNGNFNCQSLTV